MEECEWAIPRGANILKFLKEINGIPEGVETDYRDFVATCPGCGRLVVFHSLWYVRWRDAETGAPFWERAPLVAHE